LWQCVECGALATDIAAQQLGWRVLDRGVTCHRCLAGWEPDIDTDQTGGASQPPDDELDDEWCA
jgi:hypothetical protein